jgi:hypothetical protein
MPASTKSKNALVVFERKLKLLGEYRAALQEPIIKINGGDQQFIKGLEAKILCELTQLIFENPALKKHPGIPLLTQHGIK